jgi:hypothetical protein
MPTTLADVEAWQAFLRWHNERTTVDFWELTKLLFRRWYISAPLLLLSLLATAVAGVSVKPDFQATKHVQLLPPLTTQTDVAGKPRNPWNDLGIEALGNAVIIGLGDQSVLDSLSAQGHSTSFTVALDVRSPVMTVEAVAPTPQEATATAEAVGKLIDQQVLQLQKSYGAPDGTLITTRSLDAGTNVERVTSKMKRALAVIGGVGLLLTSAVTIGMDALLRNRSRRRSRMLMPKSPVDLAWDDESSGGATQAAPREVARAAPQAGSRPFVRAADRDGRAPEVDLSGMVGKPVEFRAVTGRARAAKPANGGEQRSEGAHAEADETTTTRARPPDSDATIVLPVPHKEYWDSPRRGGKQR